MSNYPHLSARVPVYCLAEDKLVEAMYNPDVMGSLYYCPFCGAIRDGETHVFSPSDTLLARLGAIDAKLVAANADTNRYIKQSGELALAVGNLQVELLAARATIEQLRAIIPEICPYCGGRMDVQPTHINRCFCLPTIKRYREWIGDRDAQLAERDATIARQQGAIEAWSTHARIWREELQDWCPFPIHWKARRRDWERRHKEI